MLTRLQCNQRCIWVVKDRVLEYTALIFAVSRVYQSTPCCETVSQVTRDLETRVLPTIFLRSSPKHDINQLIILRYTEYTMKPPPTNLISWAITQHASSVIFIGVSQLLVKCGRPLGHRCNTPPPPPRHLL